MTTQSNRNIFSLNNKYQMQIIFLITAPLFVITTALLTITYVMSAQTMNLISHQSYSLIPLCLSKWFFITVCFVLISLFTFMILAFKIAYDMVNPFNRIVLEVDEILITGSKRVIAVRPEDELAKEVTERFNKLIALIPQGKKDA